MGCTESRDPNAKEQTNDRLRQNRFQNLELEIRRNIPEIQDIEALRKLSKPDRTKKLGIKKPKTMTSQEIELLTDLEVEQNDIVSFIDSTAGIVVRKNGLVMFTGVQNSFFSPKSEYVLKWESNIHQSINLKKDGLNTSIGQFLQLVYFEKQKCHFALTATLDFSKNKNGSVVCQLYKIDSTGNISKFSNIVGYSGVKKPLSKDPLEKFMSVQTGKNTFIVFTDLDKPELKACTGRKFPAGSSYWNKESTGGSENKQEELRKGESMLKNLSGKVISIQLFGVQKISICSELGEVRAYEFGGFDEESKPEESQRKTISIGGKKKKNKKLPRKSKRNSQGSFVNKIASHDLSLYINENCEYFTSLDSGELYAVGTVFTKEESTQSKTIKRLIVIKLAYNSKQGSTWTFDFENMEIRGTWSKLYLNFFNQGSPVVIAVHSDNSKVIDAREAEDKSNLTESKLSDKFCNVFIGRVGNQGIEKVNYLMDFVHEKYQDSYLVDKNLFFLDKKMKVSQINLN